MGLLRDLSDADRSQYDKYSRPKAANVRRAPIKNAASDVGGTTAEELVRARLSTYSDNPAYGPQVGPIPERNAPPGLGRTDIVRGKPRREERREARAARSASRKEPTYNPGKGDIGIKGSFDRDYIDQIITDARDSLRGLGSQNPVKERRQDAKDIKSVLDILESKGIGAGPSPRENLAAEREIDPIIDYNDPDLFDARTAQFTDLINRSREAAGSPTTAETLFSFGFGPDPDAPPAPEPEPQPEPEPEPQPEPEPEPSRLSLDEISRKYGQFATFGHRDYQAATDLGYTDADILKYLKEDFNRLHPDNRPGGSAGLYNEILRGNVDLSKAVNIVR